MVVHMVALAAERITCNEETHMLHGGVGSEETHTRVIGGTLEMKRHTHMLYGSAGNKENDTKRRSDGGVSVIIDV